MRLVRRFLLDSVSRGAHAVVETVLRMTSAPLGLAIVYHRLGETNSEHGRYFVQPLSRSRLEHDLRMLRRRYVFVQAGELHSAARSRRRGGRIPVAITFDDDCESYATIAAPLLEAHQATATFFLTGASLGGSNPFWWESLDGLASLRQLDVPMLATQLGLTDGGPITTLADLAASIRSLPASRRRDIDARCQALAVGAPVERGLPQEAVRELAVRGFEIGFHTRWHLALTELDPQEVTEALRRGRADIELAAGQACRTVAYPYGDANASVAELAAQEGFRAGFTLEQKATIGGDSRMLTGRIASSARSSNVLARRLALALLRALWAAPLGGTQRRRASIRW